MTPVRATLASVFAAILFAAGAFIAARFANADIHDIVPLLSTGRTPFSLMCFLAAWAGLVLGGLGVLSAFVAFIAPEEDDDPRFRRRGFPKSAPIVLILIALGLVWFALRCAAANAPAPIAEPVEPSPPPVVEAPPPEPPAPPPPLPAPVRPTPDVDAANFSWPYKIPIVAAGGDIAGGAMRVSADSDDFSRLFCGKAWVAITGSASEEGPYERNIRRARMRAAAAKSLAADWINAHPECGKTIVFGLALGQHAATGGAHDDEGASTAYQRQILVVSRARLSDEELSADDARAELEAFIGDPSALSSLYGGRVFDAKPEIIAP